MANWFINIHWYFKHGCKKRRYFTVLETVHLMSEHLWERRAEESLLLQWSPKPVTGPMHKQISVYGRGRQTWWMSLHLCRVSVMSAGAAWLGGWAGRWEQPRSARPGQGWGGQQGHSRSLPRWVALAAEAQLSHSPALPEPGTALSLSTHAAHAPSCLLWLRGSTPRWRH